jgi:hypothetical protein
LSGCCFPTRSGARHPSHLGLSDAPTPFRCPYAQPVNTTEMWPCNSASCSWQFHMISLARVCSRLRGFHRSRLRLRQLFLPLASFFPKLSLVVLCCDASSAKRSSSPLDRALLLLISQWPLLVIASIPAHFHLSYYHLIPPYQLFQELLPTPCFCPVRVASPLCTN